LWFAPELQELYFEVRGIKSDPKLANEYRRTWAMSLSGIALLVGFLFTWHTLRVTRIGQLTEHYTEAIAQLGAFIEEDGKWTKNSELRMGGVYALERIARESETDHWAIMEILAACVRHWAPRQDADSSQQSNANDGRGLDPEIQAIMAVIRRRKHFFGKRRRDRWSDSDKWLGKWLRGKKPPGRWLGRRVRRLLGVSYRVRPLDLSGTDLRGAQLWEAHLEKMDLRGVNLANASLEEAHLRGAKLQGAILEGAILDGADLTDADLQDAILTGADLQGANLKNARNLHAEQLACTVGSHATKTPKRVARPDHWSNSPEKQKEEIEDRKP
jgi:hypothetical protein